MTRQKREYLKDLVDRRIRQLAQDWSYAGKKPPFRGEVMIVEDPRRMASDRVGLAWGAWHAGLLTREEVEQVEMLYKLMLRSYGIWQPA